MSEHGERRSLNHESKEHSHVRVEGLPELIIAEEGTIGVVGGVRPHASTEPPQDRYRHVNLSRKNRERNVELMGIDSALLMIAGLVMMFGTSSVSVGILGLTVCIPCGLGRIHNARLRSGLPDERFRTAQEILVCVSSGVIAGMLFGVVSLGMTSLLPVLGMVGAWTTVSILSYLAGRISPNFYK